MMPRVSVIIPTFNCAKFLGRAIRSVFAQTYTDYEVILVDDGSTDETHELVAQWESRVRYIYQPNRGPSPARNLAISKASGEFLAYLDADDMWYPHRLERQVGFLDNHPECGFVHSDVILVDEEDRVVYPEWRENARRLAPRGFCVMDLLGANYVVASSVLERRSCYDRTGGFDERLRWAEDYLHWIQVALDGHAVGHIDEPLAMYRFWGGSASMNNAAMLEALIKMFRILVEEKALFEQLGPVAEKVVHQRVTMAQRMLPYRYRQQGRNDLARRQAAALIWASPSDFTPYVELLKSCVPISLARSLRRLREVVI